ncbi:nicotinic acid mononucleotide adenylyltransferase [Rhodobacterales bacterium 52_120_T64]|nr:nicotinic acid mononucleotide adenylyltransferase [Rhodobacterales bacterium 52_120_T64]
MRIALLGGSFDPPHAGHVHITRQALRRFGLDRVWWLVSPGNPLKANGPAPIAKRMAACQEIMQHPKVEVTDIEAQLGTRFTADTIEALQTLHPNVNFVWLMGADNLASVHKWERWEWIFENVVIGVTSRPDEHLKAAGSKAAVKYRAARLPAANAKRLPFQQPPAWCLLDGPVVDISSTELRANGNGIK